MNSRLSFHAFLLGCFSTLLCSSVVLAQDGEELARTWCSSCHLYPEPHLLDKETWLSSVLPNMGLRLGFNKFQGLPRFGDPEAPEGTYADAPVMDQAEWQQIVSWYETNAPEHLAVPAWQNRNRLDLFEIALPEKALGSSSSATAVHIDESTQQLQLADSSAIRLKTYNKDLTPIREEETAGVISRILPLKDGAYLQVIIGETIEQIAELNGSLVEAMPGGSSDLPFATRRLVQNLHRPVDIEAADFNHDGALDYLVAEFGTHQGRLSLHLSQADGSLRSSTLLEEAGALSIEVQGSDVFVLMAQGRERILRIEDVANPAPSIETVMSFSPVQGSSSMQALDFDGDGQVDLLYTAGDNADISQILKPYHGIYLFLGQPDGTFRQEMFFHLDGATSAVAEDFDLDGDLDIAAIAYYGNITHGLDAGGFVYLENDGQNFTPHIVEGLGDLGRYIAISSGDIDGDGDKDIALANLAYGAPGPMEMSLELLQKWSGATQFVLLRNQAR